MAATVGSVVLLLCFPILLLLIALIAWGMMNFFQKDNSDKEMVQENQGTFEVVTVNEEEE